MVGQESAADVIKELNIGEGLVGEPEIPISSLPTQQASSESGVKSIEELQAEREQEASKQITKEVKDSITKQSNVDYESTVTLPTKGRLYNGVIPSEISLRGMTTRDEKILYAAQGGNVFTKILKSCITEPKNIDLSKLIAADELFLVMQLRMITYGPEYKVDVDCPYCGKKETYTVMLNELDVNYLPDDFEEPLIVKLPRTGHELSLRVLRNEDSEFIDRFAKKFAKQFNQNVREVEYVCRLAKFISAINGKSVDFETAKDYVEGLPARDTAVIRSAFNKISVGVDTSITVECKNCGEEFTFSMPLTSEFFRPTFD